ncbi:hypothetical protein MMC24_007387, partial [Lignoscripta atroalba]|nr:hypothetical protein [Lignoscripta atroalba]
MSSTKSLKDEQAEIIQKLHAQALVSNPYHNPQWQISQAQTQADAEALKTTAYIYYFPQYIALPLSPPLSPTFPTYAQV